MKWFGFISNWLISNGSLEHFQLVHHAILLKLQRLHVVVLKVMASNNVLFYFSLTFRSSHYVSSALDLTYLLVHLHTIEIIPFLSHTFSLSSHVCIAFNFICNMHSVCLNIFFLVFILFSFCSSVIVGYAPMFEWSFLPSSFNYSKQSNGEYIQACLEIFFIVTCDTN